jgi:hypothetical protein
VVDDLSTHQSSPQVPNRFNVPLSIKALPVYNQLKYLKDLVNQGKMKQSEYITNVNTMFMVINQTFAQRKPYEHISLLREQVIMNEMTNDEFIAYVNQDIAPVELNHQVDSPNTFKEPKVQTVISPKPESPSVPNPAIEKIKELFDLKQMGMLTEDEFLAAKTKILNESNLN